MRDAPTTHAAYDQPSARTAHTSSMVAVVSQVADGLSVVIVTG